MVEDSKIAGWVAEVNDLLAQKFRLTKGPLRKRASKLGRRVPAALRRDMQALDQAAFLSGHPKLAATLDHRALRQAHARVTDHLRAIDVADRRKGVALALLAAVMFNIALVLALLIIVLRWRGFI